MQKQNLLFVAGKSLGLDLLVDFIWFPIWWYTAGLKHLTVSRAKRIEVMGDHLALRLLVLNMFRPMFGQYDRAGRVISFFMRLVILAGRFVYFVAYIVLQAALVLLWLITPIF